METTMVVTQPANPTVQEKLLAWISPAFLIGYALFYWIQTILLLPFERPIPHDLQTLRHRAFSKLWLARGKAMSAELPGQTVALVGRARGRVLDIGPGSGEVLHRFDASLVTELWGVEPATDMHARLRANAERAGFGDRFHALACGAEPDSLVPALAKAGLLGRAAGGEGVFDDICLVRVLCGVPSPRETIHGLYRALKPGGRFIVSEHVVNPWPGRREGSPVGRLLQFYWHNIAGWRWLMGGCELERDSRQWLLDAAKEDGGWSSVELDFVNGWACVPFVVGTLTKKGISSTTLEQD